MWLKEKHWDWILNFLGIVVVLYLLWYAFVGRLPRTKFANIFLGLTIIVFFTNQLRLHFHGEDEEPEPGGLVSNRIPGTEHLHRIYERVAPFLYVAGILAAIGITIYVDQRYDYLLDTAPFVGYADRDVLVGAIAIVLVMLITLLAYGWVITFFLSLFAAFVFFGPALPSIVRHSGMSLRQIPIAGAMSLSGVYGSLTGLGATWVAIFVIFAGALRGYGLLDFVLDLATQATTRLRTGVVQIAVVSSMFFGSVVGSAAANTATTGSMTIPMMKRQGVRKDYAAAIEAVASSAGQIMPPVMGTAAFLMADILQIPYQTIIQYALLPALLFYFSAGLSTHLAVHKFGWTIEKKKTEFDINRIDAFFFVIPFVVLLYTLFVEQLSPFAAGKWTVAATILVMLLKILIQEGSDGAVRWGRETVKGFRRGAVDVAPLVAVIAAIGFSISLLEKTGVAGRVAFLALEIAGGSFIFLLIIAMLLSIILGMGMPTVAVYLLMVVFVVPALNQVDVPAPLTHMFVFYFGMLSAITPPVAIAAVIGSDIANSRFPTTAVQAVRIGLGGFIVPYVFMFHRNIVFWDGQTVVILALVVLGFVAMNIATIGYDGKSLTYLGRGFYFGAALLVLFGPFTGQLLGGVTIAVLLVLSRVELLPETDMVPFYRG
jgi:TRAP transporter 4TM/12TM fusion protein